MNSGIERCFKGVHPLIHKEYRAMYWQKRNIKQIIYGRVATGRTFFE